MLNEHHQTATCVDPAAPLVLARAGAADQEGAAADPRQSGRQPPPAGARRRGDGDGRRALEWPARMRLRARRALRGAAGQQQSGAHERAPMGGAWTSSSRPGPATTGRSATRAASSITATSTSGRAPISSRIRRSGCQHHQPGRRRHASARAAMCRRRSSPASAAPGRSTTPIARAGARPGAATTCRSTGSPMRRWSMSARARPRRAPAPRSCCGT